MRRITTLLQLGSAVLMVTSSSIAVMRHPVQADPANAPSLVISQLKITSSNGQFVTLYNTTDSMLDLGKYQLEYFNSYDLSKATSSKLIALSGTVPPHGYFMINDGTLLLCYQMTVDSVSLGLSSTAGMVELLAFGQNVPGGPVAPLLQDYAGWSKSAAAGAQILPANVNAFLQRQPLSPQNNPIVVTPGEGSWLSVQPDSSNACKLVSTATTGSANIPAAGGGQSLLLPPTQPPATIVSLTVPGNAISSGPVIPLADEGLMSPEVTELLPNPLGTGNDATNEFVELYNPNKGPFDLGGFELEAGTTTLHKAAFPIGTLLPAHGFTAFYSKDTGLSLSNGGGMVRLLDPFGKSIGSTAAYGQADDGQAWALASGKWYWTGSLTPGTANVIKQSNTAKSSSKKAKKPSKSSTSVAAAGTGTVGVAGKAGGSSADSGTVVTPIHPWTLALVATLALLYGIYEYRRDLANSFHRLGRYLRARRRHR